MTTEAEELRFLKLKTKYENIWGHGLALKLSLNTTNDVYCVDTELVWHGGDEGIFGCFHAPSILMAMKVVNDRLEDALNGKEYPNDHD